MKSLKDQLLKAGLTDAHSVKNARKRKQPKLAKKARGEASESAMLAEQALREKANRDTELNRIRQREVESKAQRAQIKQLIETTRIDKGEGDIAYSFTVAGKDGKNGKIKTIHISEDQQKQLVRNQISVVVAAADKFELVPKVVAEKIAQRDASCVIVSESNEEAAVSEDDPYADYQIPDDLIW